MVYLFIPLCHKQTVPEFKTNGFLYTLWSLFCDFCFYYKIHGTVIYSESKNGRKPWSVLNCIEGSSSQSVSTDSHTHTNECSPVIRTQRKGLTTFTEVQLVNLSLSHTHRVKQTATQSLRRNHSVGKLREQNEIWGHAVSVYNWR